MTRDTTIIKVVSSFGENLVHFIVGMMFIAGGAWIVRYALHTEPHSDKLLYVGIGVAILGAAIMPTILPVFKQIIVVVQGLPVVGVMLGGRRTGEQSPPGGSPS
jgi:hypothetical protein